MAKQDRIILPVNEQGYQVWGWGKTKYGCSSHGSILKEKEPEVYLRLLILFASWLSSLRSLPLVFDRQGVQQT